MNISNDFNREVAELCEKKSEWFNSSILPQMLENYRTFHTAVVNIISMLEKKKLITPDPYKRDKRVVDITVPPNDDFTDAEGASILGIRLSDYETSLDFLCNYMQFTVQTLTTDRIKLLYSFNSFVDWNLSTVGGQNSNVRFFTSIVSGIKASSDALSAGLLNNMLSVCSKQVKDINTELKNLTALQRELYKADVRSTIFEAPSFAKAYSNLTTDNGIQEVKKVFSSLMGNKRFYPDLINEVVNEDISPSKDNLRKALVEKLQVQQETKEKKEKTVNTRSLLFEVVKIIAGFGPSFDVMIQKIEENHELLQGESKGGFEKIVRALRSAFGMSKKTVEYKIKTIDLATQVEKHEVIDYNKFIEGMIQRSKVFKAIAIKESPLMKKLEKEKEEAVLEYVQKRIADCQNMHGILVGFDAFFKAEVMSINRSKVKGLLVDLDVIKNTIVKANKYKAEYVSTITTEKQMKKLGITDE